MSQYFNFALRVPLRSVKSKETNTATAIKAEVQAEINHSSRKVNIDRTVFTKTAAEKEEVKLAKLRHKHASISRFN